MSKNKGTLVSSTIRPLSTNSSMATAVANEILGGYHTVNTYTDRDAITYDRRTFGMLVYVLNTDEFYQLKTINSANLSDNLNWTLVTFSGGGGSGTEWLDSVIEQVKDIGYKQIILRPHPLNNPTQIRKLTEKYYKCTVNRDHNLVKNYKCVLTYNSLYAIDCLYNGIPVISLSDSSLQNQFAKYTLKDITNPPKPENREEIFSKLSYCQWREDEVRYGLPFKKLLDLL